MYTAALMAIESTCSAAEAEKRDAKLIHAVGKANSVLRSQLSVILCC